MLEIIEKFCFYVCQHFLCQQEISILCFLASVFPFFQCLSGKLFPVPNSDEIWLENQKKVYTARFCDDGMRIIALAACYLARAHTILRIYAVEEVATAADVVVVVVAAPHLARHSR